LVTTGIEVVDAAEAESDMARVGRRSRAVKEERFGAGSIFHRSLAGQSARASLNWVTIDGSEVGD
jgi:hypothetical protein